jgi:hypothetical protein
MNCKNLTLVFVLAGSLFSAGFFAQGFTEPSKLKQFNVTVNFDDYTVKTQMLSQNKKFSPDNDRVYMWYAAQKIIETKGGYDGKLIHGTYRAFYLNDQLKEKGNIKYGLKHGEWKYWYSDGKLKEVITWNNGVKNGKYFLYNDYGQLMAKGRFKDDKLNGWFYTYNGNGKIADKKKYKLGDEIVQKQRSKRGMKGWSLFKKRSKKDNAAPTEEKKGEKRKEKKESSKDKSTKKPLFKGLKKKKQTSSGSPSVDRKEIQS